jgi:hypothetical protein
MHYMNIAKHICMHYLSMKKIWSQLHCLIHSFWFFENENYNWDKRLKLFKKNQKQFILYSIYSNLFS